MNVVDSCGWLEYFADGPHAGFFADAIENIDELVVPSICIYEVFKRVAQQRSENDALRAVAMMRQGKVVDLDSSLSIHAARLGLQYKLPLSDSIIMTTAQINSAIVWTQDNDFKGLPDVRYIKK